MSYEHCDIHDCDATNGCPTCEELADEEEARAAVVPLVEQYTNEINRCWPWVTELAVAAYKLGKGPREP